MLQLHLLQGRQPLGCQRIPRDVRLHEQVAVPIPERDGCGIRQQQLFGLAVDYEGPERFVVTYGTSGNAWGAHCGPLDIGPAVDTLGYKPQDNMMQFRSRFE